MNRELGKIPPQAIDIEMVVLGAILLEKGALVTISGILKPESFYQEKHEIIYRAIQEMYQKGEVIDILTLTQWLRKSGKLEFVGGAYYISVLTERVNSAANIETHARILAECALKREILTVCDKLVGRCYDEREDAFELLEELEKSITKMESGIDSSTINSVRDILSEVMVDLAHAMNIPDGINGVPSGFISIDRVTGGWQKSDFIIIAARPAMGKTAFALCAALNSAIRFKKKGIIFSLEMSKKQLVMRMITSELDYLELSTDKLRRGKITGEQYESIHQNINGLIDSQIFIDDSTAISISRLRSKAFYLKRKYDIEWIIVDYLQLMTADIKSGNREQEIAAISRGLKNLAKDLDVPVIALAQLSRAVETRGGTKKPQLSDLRESGAIEQDADIVSFLYRPEYYGILEDEVGNDLRGIGEFIIAKHRNGSLEDILLRFQARKTKFTDPEGSQEPSSVRDYTNYRDPYKKDDDTVPY